MPSYIIRNGKLQPRQKDFNMPNYRIIPYKSTNNPTYNDYLTHTMEQLQYQIQKVKIDYHNLIHTVWKIFSQIDRTSYDPQIMFFGLKCQQIYDKISLIRSLNAYQPQQESLRLSAIMKVDDSCQIYAIQQPQLLQKSPIKRQKIKQQMIKQDNSLYQIEQEQQCISNSSRIRDKHINEKNSIRQQRVDNDKKIPSPKSINGHHRLSLQSMSGHKRQGRRSSILLRQKISLAFHEQQQLREILQEQLQKIVQQLDDKNECLSWAVQQLKIRNELIQRLKQTILLRDDALQIQQKNFLIKSVDIDNSDNNNDNNNNNDDNNRYEQLIDQKDKQIGLLINQLIQRTQQTNQDFQYLIKSVQQSIKQRKNNQLNHNQHINNQYQINNLYQNINNQSKNNNQSKYSNQFNQSIKLKQQQEQQLTIQQSIFIDQFDNQVKNQIIQSQISKLPSIIISSQSNNQNRNQSQKINQSLKINQSQNIHKSQNIQYQALKPKKMNFDSTQNISYLTKQHFLQAQKKSENFTIPNVKMTQSIKPQYTIKNNTYQNSSLNNSINNSLNNIQFS